MTSRAVLQTKRGRIWTDSSGHPWPLSRRYLPAADERSPLLRTILAGVVQVCLCRSQHLIKDDRSPVTQDIPNDPGWLVG